MARNSCGVHLGKHFFLHVSVQSADNEHNQKATNVKQKKGKRFETILAFFCMLDGGIALHMDEHMKVHMVFGSMWLLRAENVASKQHSLCSDKFVVHYSLVHPESGESLSAR